MGHWAPFLTQVLWIRWKTVIYFICKYRCLNVLIIILNIFYYGGNHDIICLKIMFLPRCSKHMSVINYLTVHYFPTHIIAPFYRGGTLWPNVCFLKCHQNTFKWSFFLKLFFFPLICSSDPFLKFFFPPGLHTCVQLGFSFAVN